MSAGATGSRINGKLLIGARATLKRDAKGRSLEELRSMLSPEAQWLLTERFLTTQWYDGLAIEEFLSTTAQWLGRDPEEYALRLGRALAREGSGSIGRTLVSLFGQPRRIARYLPAYWGRLYDSGKIIGDYDEVSKVLTVRVTNWKSHSPLMCLGPLGSMVEFSEQFVNPSLQSFERAKCISDGSAMCMYRLQYRPRA